MIFPFLYQQRDTLFLLPLLTSFPEGCRLHYRRIVVHYFEKTGSFMIRLECQANGNIALVHGECQRCWHMSLEMACRSAVVLLDSTLLELSHALIETWSCSCMFRASM